MSEPLTCHQCGSGDLTLNEVRHEYAFAAGLVLVDNKIWATRPADFEAGEIQPDLTRVTCHDCGHHWRPRRRFAGYREGSTDE